MSIFCFSPPGLIIDLLMPLNSSIECQEILNLVSEIPEFSFRVYFKYFFYTCLLESSFYFAAVTSSSKSNRPLWQRYLSTVILCNLATHPIVCFGIPWLVSLFQGTYRESLSIGESFAPLIEGLLLVYVWRVPRTPAWILSILANLFSWWVGIYLV